MLEVLKLVSEFPFYVQMPVGVSPNDSWSAFQNAFRLEVPYGLRTPATPVFSPHLVLSTVDTDPGAKVHAMVDGLIRFFPAAGADPARIDLEPSPIEDLRQDVPDAVGPALLASALPDRIVYRNLDAASVQEAVGLALAARGYSPGKIAPIRDAFMLGTRKLAASAGTFLGRAAVDAALLGRRRLDLSMIDKDGFYVNPAYFIFQWQFVRATLQSHPLLTALSSAQHRMVFRTKGTLRYVKAGNKNAASPYTTVASAAKTIAAALGVCAPGDVVVVLDASIYAEYVTIPDGVALVGSASLSTAGRVGELPTGYPTIGPATSGTYPSPVLMNGLRKGGHVSGFIITGGLATTGGAVRITNCVNVEVARTDIHHNAAGGGGGISVQQSSRVAIIGNCVRDNIATPTGGSTAWPQGGGILADASQLEVYDNAVRRNTADNFGGGIALVRTARAMVAQNDVGSTTLDTDGNRVVLDRLDYDATIVQKNPQGGGGGIGIYDGRVHLIATKPCRNQAHTGGGIEFFGESSGIVVGCDVSTNRTRVPVQRTVWLAGGDGGGIAVTGTSLDQATSIARKPVTLLNNYVQNNVAEDDGGGIFGSGYAKIVIRGFLHRIAGNVAKHDGGGIRLAYGSFLDIDGGTITANQANAETDPTKKANGGGGIALENSVAGLKSCSITSNTCNGFAGGGIYAITRAEGSAPPQMDGTLTGAYGFTKCQLRLASCTVTSNTASGTLGAGGALYADCSRYPVDLSITSSTLSPNTQQATVPEQAYNVVLHATTPSGEVYVNDPQIGSLTPVASYAVTLVNP